MKGPSGGGPDLDRAFDEVLAELVADELGPLGFTRQRRRLTRTHRGFDEVFLLRGSRYNVRGMQLEFFVCSGLAFPSLPARARTLLVRSHGALSTRRGQSVSIELFDGIDWGTRAESLKRTSRTQWRLTPGFDREALKRDLREQILGASQTLAPWAGWLRRRAWRLYALDVFVRPIVWLIGRLIRRPTVPPTGRDRPSHVDPRERP